MSFRIDIKKTIGWKGKTSESEYPGWGISGSVVLLQE